MLDLDMISILFLLLAAVAASAASYYVLRIGRAVVPDSSLNTHIVTQWTDGRLRLDFLLALIKRLGASLEQEVETLRRLGHADPQYGHQTRQMVEPNLRRFTFDQHLRGECRMLIPLLQFCAQDLAQSHSIDMTQELSALAEIQATIKLVDRD